MIKWIENLFQKSGSSQERLFNFKTISSSEVINHSHGIDALKKGTIDGFLIKNVLSKQEVDKLIANYEKVDKKEINVINQGLSIFPESFSLLDQRSENSDTVLDKFFAKAEGFWNKFPETFDFDFVQRVKDIVGQLSNAMLVSIPEGTHGKGSYNPATFKEMSSAGGELKAHCGNYFHKEFGTFYNHLETSSIIKDQLSYFVMLRPSEKGGELTLYDLRWDEVKIRQSGDTVLVDEKGKEHDLLDPKKVKRVSISPEPGDMIVFCGGQIWHKVEYIKGDTNRLTLGGFLSFTKDNKGLYIWS
ncbi:MAG: hypothetical protein ABNH00_12295 [Dokdonia sp.]|jgi:hypothetical protein